MKPIEGLSRKTFTKVQTGYNAFVAVMRLGGDNKTGEKYHFGESPKPHWSASLKSGLLSSKEI